MELSKDKSICVIIQARTGSTRLPGKAMLDICGKKAIEHVIERAKHIKVADCFVAAIPENENTEFVNIFFKHGLNVFEGNELNLIDRFYHAGKKYNAGIIVRLTGDNLFMHPEFCNYALKKIVNENADYVNILGAPIGTGVDVFTFDALERAYNMNDLTDSEKEHIIPVFFREGFKRVSVVAEGFLSQGDIRLTMDTIEDFELVKKIYDILYVEGHIIELEDVLRLLEKMPELKSINKNVRQKKWR